jgi:hypothetical protein
MLLLHNINAIVPTASVPNPELHSSQLLRSRMLTAKHLAD